VLLAALRPGMLRLAAAEADGVILNWLASTDVPTALAETKQAETKQAEATQAEVGAAESANAASERSPGAAEPGFDVVCRIFVCPTADAEFARNIGRRLITSYLTVPAYAAFHRWLGREPVLNPMWKAWAAGDRKGALAAIPDHLVDELVVHGSPAQCRHKVEAYAKAGVTVPVMSLLPAPDLTPETLPALIKALGRP
jgi:alkanesulfonate monooxygenase SsuD/methylene tetrahydromethanopterin reductase-like flavin-dependent oxidoreductase (luciferase family)